MMYPLLQAYSDENSVIWFRNRQIHQKKRRETPETDSWDSRNLNKPEATFQTSVERAAYK